ncbi:hypothetical protein ACNT2N_08805 [Pseudomonas thivervalensis]|uniref:Uncharacterized protein n=1 Tax=Pseudomonas thivervalensis TaxID=86265 RepID=A0A2Z4ZSY6_9PSED|nr:hypothetical protein [Pseudomonas thivervalensis]AXA55751.1 hypothetical protein CE140_15720 [Pseudomonas thivervalensis]AXA61568.1 hypothetical protein CEQ51_16275 [Pseudomonas thivervalensis]
MKKLYKLFRTTASIAGAIICFVRNYCADNPWVISGLKKLMVVSSIIITILSAMLWHISATWQEDVAQIQNLDQAKAIAITTAAAVLNTKAAMLGVIAALLNALYFWIGTLSSSIE